MDQNMHLIEMKRIEDLAIQKNYEDCLKKYGQNIRSNEPFKISGKIMCGPFFDELFCWQPQLANSTASEPCPSYVIGFVKTENATRQCMEDGTWFTKGNGTYTNYSSCHVGKMTTIFTNFSVDCDNEDELNMSDSYVNLIKILSVTGYSMSLISLIVAFTIMFKIKKLHCARNILHMNLFASFILRSLMQILKNTLLQNGLGLSKDMLERDGIYYFHVDSNRNFECKLLVTLVEYFTAANYSWILMEGLYLNNLILRALFTDSNKNIVSYIILGWGLPVLMIVPWAVARLLFEDCFCWTSHKNKKIFAIIIIPTFISVLINLVLFVIISVVLYKKLKSSVNEDSKRYLKWAKSTLVLVPLFGVNYAVLLIFYFMNKQIWMICDILLGSLQGFFVAILYCFLNGEVKSELKPYVTTLLIFLATNDLTKYCFPRRDKFLSSAVGRQSICTTMSCSSLYNTGVGHRRNSKTKFDQLSKIKTSNSSLHTENKEPFVQNGVRHSVPKAGHYKPNLTFVHGRYPMNMATTNIDLYLSDTRSSQYYSQNLPTCEEEASMLEDKNGQANIDNANLKVL